MEIIPCNYFHATIHLPAYHIYTSQVMIIISFGILLAIYKPNLIILFFFKEVCMGYGRQHYLRISFSLVILTLCMEHDEQMKDF